MRDKVWAWDDAVAGAAAGSFAFALYVVTLQPTVGLEDSGELITAAVHWGVPHPPGYPTWTLLGWLFAWLPLGNWAWRINLMSAVWGSVSVGGVAALGSSWVRWLAPGLAKGTSVLAGLAAGVTVAASEVMWSQAVIAEVYTLNAALLVGVVGALYAWAREPWREWALVGAAFLFAVGLTNHQTLLLSAPAVWAAAVLMVPGRWREVTVAGCAMSAAGLGVLAWLAGSDEALSAVAWRWGVAMALGVALLVAWDASKFRWKLTGALVAAMSLGLSAYALIPWAASTNPPMNWGAATTRANFYHLINRGQYGDNLGKVVVDRVGPWLGVTRQGNGPGAQSAANGRTPPASGETRGWVGWVALSWDGMQRAFGGVWIPLLSVGAVFLVGGWDRRRLHWVGAMVGLLMCVTVVQMMVMQPGTDSMSRWVGRTFLLPSHCVMGWCVALGLAGWGMVAQRVGGAVASRAVIAGLGLGSAFWLVGQNWARCDQGGHWFGWLYGTEMLRECEPNAVVFGGTDPGRFVLTNMIFCESLQRKRWKRDPSFDRSDLYIITQNALADRSYRDYVRGHYGAGPRKRRALYPAAPLWLPEEAEVESLLRGLMESGRVAHRGNVLEGIESVFAWNAVIAQAIFERNKGAHTFYLEESFPMAWTYPHAIPDGLRLRLAPEPMRELPANVVEADRVYWEGMEQRLMSDPRFWVDHPARMAFSKLRVSIANVLAWRGLGAAAEAAYRQAARLGPDNPEATLRLAHWLAARGQRGEADALIEGLGQRDPGLAAQWRAREETAR